MLALDVTPIALGPPQFTCTLNANSSRSGLDAQQHQVEVPAVVMATDNVTADDSSVDVSDHERASSSQQNQAAAVARARLEEEQAETTQYMDTARDTKSAQELRVHTVQLSVFA
jgi:hypothetical protein